MPKDQEVSDESPHKQEKSLLDMTPHQLRRRIRDLENLKKKDKTLLTILKDCKYLQINLAAKEKESARMKKSIRMGNFGEGSKPRRSSKGHEGLALQRKREKDAIIRDQAENLKDVRKTNNLVR